MTWVSLNTAASSDSIVMFQVLLDGIGAALHVRKWEGLLGPPPAFSVLVVFCFNLCDFLIKKFNFTECFVQIFKETSLKGFWVVVTGYFGDFFLQRLQAVNLISSRYTSIELLARFFISYNQNWAEVWWVTFN